MGCLSRAAVRGMVSLCLLGALTACGGGGGGSDPPPASSAGREGTWQVQRLTSGASGSVNLYPGNTYQPIGGDAGYALWIGGPSSNRTLNISHPDSLQRGFATRLLMDGLPSAAANNATIAVVSGEWSMITWTESTFPGTSLYVRLKGSAFDTGAVLVSTQMQGAAWDVRLAVDQAGNARAIWDESGRQGVNGRFVAGVWVPEADLGFSLTYLQRYLVGPDGQGWLFRNANGGFTDEVIRFTASGGVGAPQTLGLSSGASARRVASAEGPDGFQTATYLYPSFLIRRMVNGVLQPETSVIAQGTAATNSNYVSFDSDDSGRAVLAWGAGVNDNTVYAARRSAAGVWSAPTRLAELSSGASLSPLSGLMAEMGPQGQALVVYRGQGGTLRAVYAEDGGAWSAPVELARSGYQSRSVAIEFNAQGVPGVLQLINGPTDAGVLMSTWRNGAWTTESLRSGTQLVYIYSTFASTVRLAAHGANGWLAIWDEGLGPGSLGNRDVWLAEYR